MAATAEYTKQQEGNSWVFNVTPAKGPKFILLAIGGAILILMAFSFGSDTGLLGYIIFLPVGALGIWAGYFRDARPPAHRVPTSFRVTSASVEASGRTFPKDDIHRLIIKNSVSKVVVGAPAVVVGGVPTATAMGQAWRAQAGLVANALEVETGGKAYLLAGGMDETTAFGLLADVSKIMGLSIS